MIHKKALSHKMHRCVSLGTGNKSGILDLTCCVSHQAIENPLFPISLHLDLGLPDLTNRAKSDTLDIWICESQ